MNSPVVPRPVLLVGGFERHNFGDLLMGRVMETCLRERGLTPVFVSLLPADLRAVGGSWVHALADLAPCLSEDVPVVHAGGETIPCTMRDGLRMDVPPEIPAKLASALAKEGNPTGLEDRVFAYLTPPEETIRGRRHAWNQRFFYAQGAFTLARAEPVVIAEAQRVLAGAKWLTARENTSVAALRAAGLPDADFSWDGGALVPCLLPGGTANLEKPPADPVRGGTLLLHANEVYLTKNGGALAEAVARAAGGFQKVEVALAGLAANHDSASAARELVRMLAERGVSAEFAGDIHADAIVARIRRASCVVSTSLHYRIMALTHGVPRVSLENEKVSTWARNCDAGFPHGVEPPNLPEAIAHSLEVSAEVLRETALTARRAAFSAVSRMLDKVAAAADSPTARFTPPAEFFAEGQSFLPPGPQHALVPREWLAALSGRAAGNAEAKNEIRRLKDELKSTRAELAAIQKSAAWKLLRRFRRR